MYHSYQHSPTICGFIMWAFTEAALHFMEETVRLALNFPQFNAFNVVIFDIVVEILGPLQGALPPLTGPILPPAGC